MKLRIVREGLLDGKTHRIMKMIVDYVSSYGIKPEGMDLEVAFSIEEDLCREIANDVEKRFRRHLKYIEVACL